MTYLLKSIKSEYSTLASDYTKFALVRTAIMFTVVLTLFSAVNKLDSEDTQQKIGRVWLLSQKTKAAPEIGDFIIDKLYFSDAAGARYLLRLENSGSVAKDSIEEGNNDSLSKQQQTLLREIETALTKPFEVKITFIADTNLDLRYWIFIFPFFLLASFVYTFIMDAKIKKLEIIARNNLAASNQSDASVFLRDDTLTPYSTHLFKFTRNFLRLVEAILLVIFVYSLVVFFKTVNIDDVLLILFFYFLIIYFSIGYAINKYFTIIDHTWPAKPASVPFIINLWSFVEKVLAKIVNILPYRLTSGIGILAILASLFMVMSLETCNSRSEKMESVVKTEADITITPDSTNVSSAVISSADNTQHDIKTTDNAATEIWMDDENKAHKGYELITGFGGNVWQFSEGGNLPNRFYQCLYILAIISSFLLLSFQFYKSDSFPVSRNRRQLINIFLIVIVNLFLLFTIYFSFVPFVIFFLLYPAFLISIILLAIFNIRNKKYIFDIAIPENIARLQRAVFAASLPFFLLAIFNLLYYRNEIKGWLVFYLGLLLIMIGAFKLSRQISFNQKKHETL